MTFRDCEPVAWQVREVRWMPDRRRGDCSSAKPKHRSRITLPGYRAGLKPPNWKLTFPPEPLDDAEIRRLLATFGSDAKRDVRNRALITVLWRTGLRVSEALDLRPHHVDFAAKRVKVLRGKGSKTRTVAIDNVALAEVSRWLMCRITLGVPVDAPLFCTVNRPTQGGHLHPAYLRTLLRKHRGRAAISKRVHPHGFRHTMACELWRAGYPLSAIQRQLGHSSAGTTDTYLRGMGADEGLDLIAAREGSHA
jgi:integrase